ncbi:hypothetical protein KC358_g75 [Hortaea werneckii]|nr:hypothetical protein KC358_g75 [Hortaea werneckii]
MQATCFVTSYLSSPSFTLLAVPWYGVCIAPMALIRSGSAYGIHWSVEMLYEGMIARLVMNFPHRPPAKSYWHSSLFAKARLAT